MQMPSFPIPAQRPATPESVSRRRRMAEGLMAQGMDTAPIGHWTQGLARMLQAGVGGYDAKKADQAEAEGRTAAQQKMIEMLGSPAVKSSAYGS
jgi:flagellar protein FlgJ